MPSSAVPSDPAVRVGAPEFRALAVQALVAGLRASGSRARRALDAASSTRALDALDATTGADALFDALVDVVDSDRDSKGGTDNGNDDNNNDDGEEIDDSDEDHRRTLACRALCLAARATPPALLRPRWLGLARRVLAALKGAPPERTSALLLALAALVAAAAPYGALGGPALAALTSVAEPAVLRGTRVLEEALSALSGAADGRALRPGTGQTSQAQAALAAIALLTAVAQTTPAQMRSSARALDTTLWELGVCCPCPRIQTRSAVLLATLAVCHPPKSRPDAVLALFDRACKQLVELCHVFTAFRVGAGSRLPLSAQLPASSLPDVQFARDSAYSIALRFQTMCEVVCTSLTTPLPEPLQIDVPGLISAITAVLDITNLDPYAMSIADIDVSSVAAVLPLMRIASYRTLAVIVRVLRRPGLLPFAATLSQVVARGLVLPKRSDSVHTVQRVSGGVAERHVVYETALACISALGGPAIEVLAAPLASSLSEDLPAAVSIAKAASVTGDAWQAQLSGGPLQGLAAHVARPGKRRRHQGGGSRQEEQDQRRIEKEAFSSADFDPPELQNVFAADSGLALVNATIQAVDACREVFSSRAFFSERTVASSRRMEHLIVSALPVPGDLGCSVLRALAACVLGGGSGRLAGCASPVLPHAIFALRSLSRDPSSSEALVLKARATLSACESLVHPRGPPMVPLDVNTVRRKIDENALRSSTFNAQQDVLSFPTREKPVEDRAEIPATEVQAVQAAEHAVAPPVSGGGPCSTDTENQCEGKYESEDDPTASVREFDNKNNAVKDTTTRVDEELPIAENGNTLISSPTPQPPDLCLTDRQWAGDRRGTTIVVNEAEQEEINSSGENETFIEGELRISKRTREEFDGRNEASPTVPSQAKRLKQHSSASAHDGEIIDEGDILSSLVVDEGPDEDESC